MAKKKNQHDKANNPNPIFTKMPIYLGIIGD
jgi:hypothetical protein